MLTGAGKGIGFATLQRLYDADANIAIITRSKIDINKIKKNFRQKRYLVFAEMFLLKKIESFFLSMLKKK